MKFAAAAAVLTLLALAAAPSAAAAKAEAGAGSPVERIVKLLKDLQAKTLQDGENEEKIYNKFACWCDKSLKLKADAIDQARADLRATGQEILKLKAKIATRTSEIEELTQAIKENVELQEEATALRQKANAKYMEETEEMKQAIAALQEATTVLVKGSGAGGASLLQASTGVRKALSGVLQALPVRTSSVPQKHIALLSEFLQQSSGYAPQSGTVQGILKDMYSTFTADLEDATLTEATENRDFEALIAVKTEEKVMMEATRKDKEAEKAEYEQNFAMNSELYDATQAQMKADTAFFDVAKEGCLAKSEEWNTRKSLRQKEVEGIEKALEILTSDEARELFAKSIKAGKEVGADEGVYGGASLLQVGSASSGSAASAAQAAVGHAYARLQALAAKSKNIQLAQLAVQVREAKVGHFDAVVKAIDNMVTALQEEGQADIEKRDQCKDEYLKIASAIGDLKWKITRNSAHIAKMEALIEKKTAQKEDTIEQTEITKQSMKDMTAQRKEENEAFLQAKKDDQNAIDLLSQAKKVLSKYYKENDISMGPVQGSVKGASLQQEEPEFERSQWEAPDATFSGKGKRKGESKGIVSMMSMMIEDLTDEIRNGMTSETESQLAFEQQMEAAQKLLDDLREKTIDLKDAIAKHGEEKNDEEKRKKNNQDDLKDEVDYKANIKPDCDWILGAFEERATRRAAEMEGLGGAKEYLAGATLLQTGQKAPSSRFLRARSSVGALQAA